MIDSIPPSHGASVPDVIAVAKDTGPDRTIYEWRKRNGINPAEQIHLTRLVHMRYQHPDLKEITTFLKDFGMYIAKETDTQIWYRGYGSEPYVYYAQKGPKKFLGGTFEVETFEDLVKAKDLPGAGEIEELKDAPGGGHLITFQDPEGFPVNLIYGQISAERGKLPEKLVLNYGTEKPRTRTFQRFSVGPAAVHKLGHFGLCVQNLDAMIEFYTRNFNIVPSDFLWIEKDGQKKHVGLFAHIDRGEDLVDHHSFFLSSNPTSHVHHCSFEVHDYDTQNLGHQWLAKRGYKSVWGIGRHILGSQIFDYWWDTTGNMIEHYADGDMVNIHTPIGYLPAGDESLAVWGPQVPDWFLQ